MAFAVMGALRTRPAAQARDACTNAAVVGILGAALYNPVLDQRVLCRAISPCAHGFPATTRWKMPPWIVVVCWPPLTPRQLSHRR